jgi:hypothetical protein
MLKLFMCAVLSLGIYPAIGLAQQPPMAEHQKELFKLKEASENFTDDAYYSTSWFKHKKTGEIKKFTVFTKLEKQMFYLWNAEKISIEFARIQQKWEKELENMDENSDLGRLLLDLVVLRKTHALKYEQALKNMFDNFPDEFTKEEKSFITNRIIKYHDDNKLIQRN